MAKGIETVVAERPGEGRPLLSPFARVCIGMGLFQALNLFVIWDYADYLQVRMSEGMPGWYMVFALCTVAGCVLVGVWAIAAGRTLREGPGVGRMSSLSCALVTLAVPLSLAVAQSGSDALFLACAVLYGLSIATLSVFWVQVIAMLPDRLMFLSLVVSSLICLPALCVDVVLGAEWYPAVLAFLSCGTVWFAADAGRRCEGAARGFAEEEAGRLTSVSASGASTAACAPIASAVSGAPTASTAVGASCGSRGPVGFVPELLCSFIVCVVVFLERTICPSDGSVGPDAQRLVLIERLASVLLLALLWFVAKRRPTCAGSFVFVFPVLAALVLAPLAGPWGSVLSSALSGTIYVTFAVIVRSAAIDISSRQGISLPMTFSFLLAALLAGMPVGTALGNLLVGSGLADETVALLSTLVLLYALTLVLYVLLRSRTRAGAKGGLGAMIGTAAGIGEPGASAGESETDVLSRRVRLLGAERGLSERQVEIVDYVVHGYDASSVAQKLCLSENTVRTHIKRTYQHLDIHSKKELVELVASVDAKS